MKSKFSALLFIVFIILFYFVSSLNAQKFYNIKYYGCSGIVDLNSDEYSFLPEISEDRLKRLSVDITRLYHAKGYSAFYIEEIVVKPDHTIEFYCNESMVSTIVVSGIGQNESDQVKNEIFPQGLPYNEIVIKKNIALIKEKYGYSNVHIQLERDIYKDIIIKVNVIKITNRLDFSVTGSPVYGALLSVSWDILFEKSVLHMGFNSSFAQKQARMSNLSIFYNRKFNHIALLSGFNLRESKDFLNEEMLYRNRSVSPEISVYHFFGAMGAAIVFSGDYYALENYNETGDSSAYSGYGGVKVFYNNRSYVIDKRENKNFSIETGGGSNSLEKKAVLRVKSEAFFSFQVFSRVALISKNYFFMTTEKERLFQEYVFDHHLPGRMNDYTVSNLKNSAGVEVEFELYPSLFYAGPLLYYGIYEKGNNDFKNFLSAGIGLSFELKGAVIKGAYVHDLLQSKEKNSFLFSVSGSF